VDFENELEGTVQKIDELCYKFADRFRSEVLIPFCHKHRLEFTSGMGSWVFSLKHGSRRNIHLDDFGVYEDTVFTEKWEEIEAALNQDLAGHRLGEYVCDVP